jgi:hypothetical protein
VDFWVFVSTRYPWVPKVPKFRPAGYPATCMLELVCCGSFVVKWKKSRPKKVPKSRSDAWWYFNGDPNIKGLLGGGASEVAFWNVLMQLDC